MAKDTFDPYAPLRERPAAAASEQAAPAEPFDPYAKYEAPEAPPRAAPAPEVGREPRPMSEIFVSPEGDINPVPIGAGVGAAGAAAFGPRVEPPPQITTARAGVAGAEAGLEAARRQAAQSMLMSGSQADMLKLQLDAARAEMDAARYAYDMAKANAQKLGALPETLSVTNVPSGAAPGTSASPEGLSQGALRHSGKMGEITEANLVRKGAAPLTGYTQLSRLIVPNELGSAPIYNSIQKSAQAELSLAEKAFQDAVKNLGIAQSQWQKATGATPPSVAAANTRVAGQEIAAAKAKARLQELEKAYPGMEKFRAALRGGLNIAGGALSGAELSHAIDLARQGKWMDAALAASSGVGGAMMLSKDPRTAAMGAVVSAPGLATQIPKLYQEYIEPRLFPPKSVMED